MNKSLIVCFFIFGIFFSFSAQDYWEQRDSVNGPSKAVCVSFVLQGEGYVLGGLDDFGFKRKMYSYNQFQDDWDDEASIGGENGDGLERGSACAFAIGNKGYVCLGQGQTNPYSKDLWEYDSQTETWSQKADFGGSARRQAVAFTINELAYVGTGQDANGLKQDFYKYDPITNTWTQLNDFPGTARRQAVGFSMGSQGYLGTGDDGVLKNDFWMYEPSTDSWVQKANFPGTPRAGATGWGIFPTAFIATGEDLNFEYKNDVWEYNYFGNSWVQRADLIGSGRKNAISFVLDGIAFLGTGYNGEFLDDFYAYHRIVGISENQSSFDSSVFPVPALNSVNISIGTENESEIDIQIFSIEGKELTYSVDFNFQNNLINLNTTNLKSGSYIYLLKNNNTDKTSSGKFIIQ